VDNLALTEEKSNWCDRQNNGETCARKQARMQVDPQVLDFAHLGRYTNGDEALEQELLGLFKVQAILQFESIDGARCKDDWEMSVHTLKGSALGVGAVQVANMAAELEKVGFAGEKAEKAAKLTALKYAVAKCVVTIEELSKLT